MDEADRLRNVYQRNLRLHAHALIAMGYQELQAEDYANKQEPEITGELVRAMREILERSSAPAWAEYYTIHDDPPLNVPGKRGKKRPRVDIEFERINRGIRPRLRFEAKRLGKNHGVKQYLGQYGLGCFTSGRYPTTHSEAGMLGYVQNRNEAAWANKIEATLRQAPATYFIVNNEPLEQHRIIPQLLYTYRSKHHCQALGQDIDIFHILLHCCKRTS
jgi:hypothetical protein